MSKNVFTVDLGKLEISSEQSAALSSAIQSAAMREIASWNMKDKLAFIPHFDYEKGIPNKIYWRGFVVINANEKVIQELQSTIQGAIR